ncbi:hypothetical protein EVAR_232_1 [Eumeta japonica]|uniref:Uncharacterized protein n=1 Tax=Eumeta variegata TaxID=151549 RepID=A0A4C1S985_EUMVA|nr:hypothetical protein EVAR_232_1 [Eumeta japonica]
MEPFIALSDGAAFKKLARREPELNTGAFILKLLTLAWCGPESANDICHQYGDHMRDQRLYVFFVPLLFSSLSLNSLIESPVTRYQRTFSRTLSYTPRVSAGLLNKSCESDLSAGRYFDYVKTIIKFSIQQYAPAHHNGEWGRSGQTSDTPTLSGLDLLRDR